MKKHALSVLYMFVITMVFAALVSAVKMLNEDRIEANRIAKLRRVILDVMEIPSAESGSGEDLGSIFSSRVRDIQVSGRIIYVGYKEDGRTIQGYAFPVGGPGFWGPISGMVGLAPDASRILSLIHI